MNESPVIPIFSAKVSQLSRKFCIFADVKETKGKSMGIERNEPFIDLQFEPRINKDNMFSYMCWKDAINWDLILAQIKKTEHACLLIDS
mgnify:CR=1 FL=1